MLISQALNNNSAALSVSRIIFGAILIATMANIIIPMYPVPISLQTVACMLIGLLYRPKEALFTLITYLTAGAIGLPVFIGGTYGIAKFVGPTAGYLVGFTLGTFAVSYIRCKYEINLGKFINTFLLVVLGQVIIYTFGIIWLSHLIGFNKAIYVGCIVFIPSGIVKSLILSLIFRLAYVKRS